MSKIWETIKRSYVFIILAFVYIPLVVGAIFTFNKSSDKGTYLTSWSKFSWSNWATIFNSGRDIALINSIILAILTSIIVITISLISVYAVYRSKSRVLRSSLSATSNIPLINPDNITAIGLVLVFTLFFGVISSDNEGFSRVVIGHAVMTLPYAIFLMYPRSEKFNNNLFEASMDLGYSKIRSWFKTYFVYMIPSIIMTTVVCCVFSFDDFIITRTTSNTPTLGLKLYEGQFEAWALCFGVIALIMVIFGNAIYISIKNKHIKRNKKSIIIKRLFNKNKNKGNFENTIELNLRGGEMDV